MLNVPIDTGRRSKKDANSRWRAVLVGAPLAQAEVFARSSAVGGLQLDVWNHVVGRWESLATAADDEAQELTAVSPDAATAQAWAIAGEVILRVTPERIGPGSELSLDAVEATATYGR